MSERLLICDGPSLAVLKDAFFHETYPDPQFVNFEIENGAGIDVILRKASHEDDSGTSYNFEGWQWENGTKTHNLRGYYSTRLQKGWVAVV